MSHKKTADKIADLFPMCNMCGCEVHIEIKTSALEAWRAGRPIQDAAPDLSADDREMLISQTCGKCFDKLTGGGFHG